MIIDEPTWNTVLKDEFQKEYFKKIKSFVRAQKAGQNVFPPENMVFRAFNTTPYKDVKVVILGQDPYHEAGQAEGLSFSVPDGCKLPPSLKNIIKELRSEYGVSEEDDTFDGSLVKWAEQGVLLLNTVLTVAEGKAFSHSGIGWECFTDEVIRKINDKKEPVVYLVWGKPAAQKRKLIDNPKHLVLESAHPSPLSAYRGFFGCDHFIKTNQFLEANGVAPIDWTAVL